MASSEIVWIGRAGSENFSRNALTSKRNVRLALPKRRQLDLHHIQTEIEVLAKTSGANGRFQVAIGRGNDARPDADALIRTHRLDFMFLKSAQKLGLQVDGQVADFIQKKGSLASGLEQALLRMLRSRERALHVAEQFGFDQRRNQRGTVHGGKRLIVPRARKMNRARDKFLSGAAFPEDQDGVRMLGNFLDQLVHALHAGRHADRMRQNPAGS